MFFDQSQRKYILKDAPRGDRRAVATRVYLSADLDSLAGYVEDLLKRNWSSVCMFNSLHNQMRLMCEAEGYSPTDLTQHVATLLCDTSNANPMAWDDALALATTLASQEFDENKCKQEWGMRLRLPGAVPYVPQAPAVTAKDALTDLTLLLASLEFGGARTDATCDDFASNPTTQGNRP